MTEPVEVHRGDILWIECDPSVGSEPRKVRTCVVVSNNLANRHAAGVTVIPTLSYSATRAERPFLIDLRRPRSTLKAARVANASCIMTYDRMRVVSRAGRVGAEALRAIDRALAIHLAIAEP
ncbi:MAG: type II toxin-antitoxin system PemK/MazF family toxin [Deltaproteobacteria bacterium]|nr:type II toxin-antitoxin system PemK/MazF family toxin [Deltaproteobacteria bacterium]